MKYLFILFTVIFSYTAFSQSEVKIGTQIWTSKNLDVSTYRNGDSIVHVRTSEEWQDALSSGVGAWCYYNFEPKNGEIYGKLYNWYAVKDVRGLAPQGYHIPSDLEWSLIVEYLGGKGAGYKIKSTSGWSKGGNGDNGSGFSGLPGGYCSLDGGFGNIGKEGYWWSSSEYSTNLAWYRYLGYSSSDVNMDYSNKEYGFSIRCIRD